MLVPVRRSNAGSQMSLSSVQLPKPKDWQAFERQTRELFACVLDDPATQMHGRSGQKQHGVDVYGRRGGAGTAWVGVQCKHSEDEITESELRTEFAKALNFTPPISEFILATTALRDNKIQSVARAMTTAQASTSRPVVVEVWGWQNIEEEAAKYARAHKAFDPTWNPYAEEARQETAVKLQSLHDKLDSFGRQPSSGELTGHDRNLLLSFRAKITPGLVLLLREHDFGNPVHRADLDALGEVTYTWKGPAYEFVDAELQAAFEPVMAGIGELARLVATHIYQMGNSPMGTPKTDEDQHGLTEATKRAIKRMNDAGTALTNAIDDFDRIARKKAA